jgi:hypothetical protein
MEPALYASIYESTIAQFSMRIRQRDTVLLFYLGAAGAIASLSFAGSSAQNAEMLLLLPVLGGACGLIMAYHSLFVEALVGYCVEQLAPEMSDGPCIFEKSLAFAQLGMRAVKLRTWANVLILLLPPGFTLLYLCCGVGKASVNPWLLGLLTLFAVAGAIALLWADYLHIREVRSRNRSAAAAHQDGREPPAGADG